ncbi:hypothetical protein NPIL_83931 [Nephila pilipes]|uniref:Uncharacterized protein n=1 Tax=Nephila pilipes TaxID=299642 RepID=A0A8X6NJM0_NEPPI|nr:hypothetical protein NPIL_83931 [Nephila pilipes]
MALSYLERGWSGRSIRSQIPHVTLSPIQHVTRTLMTAMIIDKRFGEQDCDHWRPLPVCIGPLVDQHIIGFFKKPFCYCSGFSSIKHSIAMILLAFHFQYMY